MPGLLQVLQRMNIPYVVRQAVCSQGEVIFPGPFLGNTGFPKLVCGQESQAGRCQVGLSCLRRFAVQSANRFPNSKAYYII
mgnify:CR=1 FL=1